MMHSRSGNMIIVFCKAIKKIYYTARGFDLSVRTFKPLGCLNRMDCVSGDGLNFPAEKHENDLTNVFICNTKQCN